MPYLSGMMRLATLLATAFVLLMPPASLVRAQTGEAPATRLDTDKPDQKPLRQSTLDELFERLKGARDESEGKAIAASIERRWLRSGSATADLLMSRANEATAAGEHALAVEIIDRLLVLEPQWAEAWNRRATLFYLMGDQTRAMADIEQALLREPRHFGALAGLGVIFHANGDKKRALSAFQKALALNPWLEQLKSALEQLEPEVRGKAI